ncbi:class I tRNA ligase family protein, partial [Bacillus pumilus]|uniref:class I tRNA ligase family protein n=1 Tax=Bacillus pumilus TaxID=1408 RepID=UPI0021B223C6
MYYPRGKLHIGDGYTRVGGDAMAGYKGVEGYDVMYLRGRDEEGEKIEEKGEEEKMRGMEYLDGVVGEIERVWKKVEIWNDDLMRRREKRDRKMIEQV